MYGRKLMIHDCENRKTLWSRFPRFPVRSAIFLLLLAGAVYAWTCTPSYSLFRIKYALEAHDYATFSRYVDVDSVIDHALDDLAEGDTQGLTEDAPRDLLSGLFGKRVLKDLARGVRPLMKAGIAIAVEQAVKDQDRPLPQIPFFAVIGALWYGSAEEDRVSFPIKLKKGKHIAVKAKQAPNGVWRVDEVDDMRTLLSTIKSRRD